MAFECRVKEAADTAEAEREPKKAAKKVEERVVDHAQVIEGSGVVEERGRIEKAGGGSGQGFAE